MLPQTTENPDPGTYSFSPRELQRLAVYRAAVIARFYNDELDSLEQRSRLSPARNATVRRGPSR